MVQCSTFHQLTPLNLTVLTALVRKGRKGKKAETFVLAQPAPGASFYQLQGGLLYFLGFYKPVGITLVA